MDFKQVMADALKRAAEDPRFMRENQPGERARQMRKLMNRRSYAKAIAIADSHAELFGDEPLTVGPACMSLAALGRIDEAIARLTPVLFDYDWGYLWALKALLERQRGRADEAAHALATALTLGVHDKETAAELATAFGLALEKIGASEQSTGEARTLGELIERRNASPGAHLRPHPEGPHSQGGEGPQMPQCPGCKRSIRLHVLLDVAAEARLQALIPSFPWFPLLGCVDCTLYVGRHDYAIDVKARRVALTAIASSVKRHGSEGTAAKPSPPPARFDLVWNAPGHEPPDGPQILGEPPWMQEPQRMICRGCRRQMAFVAAMGSMDWTIINGENGYQYHFACDACRTVSVIAQFT